MEKKKMDDEFTLTIYSDDYDSGQNAFGNGMNGKVFLENGKTGREFKSANDALDFAVKQKMQIDEIVYCYQDDGEQLFSRFSLNE